NRPAATALIERMCTTHPTPDPEGPHVTVVDGLWSYCSGHAEHGHKWRAIEPRPRQQLETEIASHRI
ncbi:MAG TPA: hypothetical protein VJ726_07100, partial [Candidatus Limnocylindria bacterium]|nr:hypothetical protein [Candidatus Limnocylindria bacterium]